MTFLPSTCICVTARLALPEILLHLSPSIEWSLKFLHDFGQ